MLLSEATMQTQSISSPNPGSASQGYRPATAESAAGGSAGGAKPVDQAQISPQAKALAEAEQRGPLTAPAQPPEEAASGTTRTGADREQARSEARLAPERQAANIQGGSRQAQSRIDTIV
jgi:hypothetical protein